MCWICLDEKQEGQPLYSPCACPRKVHPKCLARWQLQQAGRPEETHCRYVGNTRTAILPICRLIHPTTQP